MHDAMDRDEAIRTMRAKHSSDSHGRGPKLWIDSKLQRHAEDGAVRTRVSKAELSDGGFPVTGPWTFKEPCAPNVHKWVCFVDERWTQCRACLWCRPLGLESLLQLPPMFDGQTLPRLNDVGTFYALAGFVLPADLTPVRVRVRVVQYVESVPSQLRRCGVEVLGDKGRWWEAGVFWEDQLYKVLPAVAAAEPGKPKALWRALQQALGHGWLNPWETA